MPYREHNQDDDYVGSLQETLNIVFLYICNIHTPPVKIIYSYIYTQYNKT